MKNPIKEIYRFNEVAGLLDQGYSDERECAFPIEEALEGFPLIKDPKAYSRQIVSDAISSDLDISDLDRLDKHLDIIVFSFGSIFKLGLNAQQATHALNLVMEANMKKVSAGKDSHGKQLKPSDWERTLDKLNLDLKKILDERA